jgi:hypothetical protein
MKVIRYSIIVLLTIVILISGCIFNKPDSNNLDCNATFNETAGNSNESYNLSVAVYVAGSKNYQVSYSNEQIKNIINGANEIWRNYKIRFLIEGDINRSFENILDDDVVEVGENHHNYDIDGEYLGKIVIPEQSYKKINIIFINRFKCKPLSQSFFQIEEQCVDGKKIDNSTIFPKLVIVSKKLGSTKDVSNASWNLAHEMGHVLIDSGLNETDTRYNLMTHNQCIKEKYHPNLLNQTQVDMVIREVNRFLNETRQND